MAGNKKWVKGGSLYDFYLVEWAGVNPENGNPMWYRYNTNGEKVTTEDYSSTTPDDKVKCGNSLPDWTRRSSIRSFIQRFYIIILILLFHWW